jgi:hypothetical protein
MNVGYSPPTRVSALRFRAGARAQRPPEYGTAHGPAQPSCLRSSSLGFFPGSRPQRSAPDKPARGHHAHRARRVDAVHCRIACVERSSSLSYGGRWPTGNLPALASSVPTYYSCGAVLYYTAQTLKTSHATAVVRAIRLLHAVSRVHKCSVAI